MLSFRMHLVHPLLGEISVAAIVPADFRSGVFLGNQRRGGVRSVCATTAVVIPVTDLRIPFDCGRSSPSACPGNARSSLSIRD